MQAAGVFRTSDAVELGSFSQGTVLYWTIVCVAFIADKVRMFQSQVSYLPRFVPGQGCYRTFSEEYLWWLHVHYYKRFLCLCRCVRQRGMNLICCCHPLRPLTTPTSARSIDKHLLMWTPLTLQRRWLWWDQNLRLVLPALFLQITLMKCFLHRLTHNWTSRSPKRM